MPLYEYVILAAGTLLWFAPFPLTRWNFKSAAAIDRRARWGVVLEAIGYSLLWQGEFWARAPAEWRVAVSILFFTIACFFSWTGTRALGRHLRLDAALNPDHELVRSGPYRVIRHPIYASMLCVLLGTGFLVARWALLIAGVLVFIAGTEIRVRIEDKLLASRFGDEFLEYRRGVPAYIPLIR
ncbi:MAG TPA: isoprenylcysteine carboxylmethyltransferase family protein [Bryobacteraceae bacterium]|nr:isoprenylcysteine carboxylmethyltransferase family protein [Bryobacteraceae bacterium]